MMDDQTIDLPRSEMQAEEQIVAELTAAQILDGLARSTGDISDAMSEADLGSLGSKVIEDYEQDCSDREDWARVAKEALQKAAQCGPKEAKTYPWNNASNVKYPLLTIAALQFNARAYPAIVKGDEAVSCKVVGADRGMPVIGPNGQPAMGVNGVPVVPMQGPQGPVLVTVDGQPVDGQPEPLWQRPPGAKSARAQRVRDYMNAQIFYRMDDWEADTDMLLMQLPIVGCAFRKVYYKEAQHCAKLVSALNLVVPCDTKELKTATRISEVLPPMAPYEILENIRSGYFRPVQFVQGEDFMGKGRQLIEQHCRYDMDGDGYPEPYVVTVDHESREVLRVVANYDADGIKRANGTLSRIEPRHYYVKYGFFPHPEGKFYDLGLGHLLDQIGNVVDTIINQMIDAGTAQVAGGGFIGSGVRLQGAGRTSTIRMQPGEWKTVNVSGDQLRNAMVERTFPNPSAVMYQVLELLLGAAQDISSVKDVLTGDASNNGQVGTTLALIEQGLQMFTAIYKRVYRGLKEEFQLLFDNIGKHGTEETAQDYVEVLDDPQADFTQDFNAKDMDIRPVSDPTSVTRMQKMARAQFLGQFLAAPGVNPQAIYKRMWEAADVEDAEELLMPPAEPGPKEQAEVAKDMSAADKNSADAEATRQNTEVQRLETLAKVFQAGVIAGS